MKDKGKTKAQLIKEMAEMHLRIRELEKLETERAEAEKALRGSEERLRRITDHMVDLAFQLDARAVLQYLTPSVERVLGYHIADVLGKSAFDFIHPDDRESAMSAFLEVMKTGYGMVEVRIQHHDGHYVWMELLGNALAGDNGERGGMVVGCRDTTDRKQAEKALWESEARHKLITDNMTDTVWLMDMNLKTTWCNPSVERNRGYTLEEINALPMERHVTPKSIEIILKTLSEELTPERLQQKELNISREMKLEFYRKDGSTLLSEVRFALLRDPQGSPIGLMGVGRDITERNRVEQALRESEERYRYLIQHAPTGIFEADFTARKYLSVNVVMCQYTGYTREEFLSLNPIQLLTEESMEAFIQRHAKVLAGEPVPDDVEFKIKRKDGSEFWVLLHTRYSYEPNNRITATVIAHDITERKQVEDARRESEEKYRL